MDLRERIVINGMAFRVNEYTEKRRSKLEELNKEVADYIEKNETKKWSAIPIADKVSFWRRRTSILLVPEPTQEQKESDFWDKKNEWLSDYFFQSEDFEYSVLAKVESFFFTRQMYL